MLSTPIFFFCSFAERAGLRPRGGHPVCARPLNYRGPGLNWCNPVFFRRFPLPTYSSHPQRLLSPAMASARGSNWLPAISDRCEQLVSPVSVAVLKRFLDLCEAQTDCYCALGRTESHAPSAGSRFKLLQAHSTSSPPSCLGSPLPEWVPYGS